MRRISEVTESEYNFAAFQYELGNTKLKDLAVALRVSYCALGRKFREDNIKKGGRLKKEKAGLDSADYQQVQLNYFQWLTWNSKLAMQLAMEVAKDDKSSISLYEGDLRSIKMMSEILSRNCNTTMKLIGHNAAADGELEEFVVSEMTAEDVQRVRDEQKQNFAEVVPHGELE
ncbi:hypothetical protein JKP31_16135 [Vibrio vulnificus]|uniref:hypothetical protein n=1 Tax=Vibrio vulnificus TaxID=672 RepID=UPI001CDC1599|nr:hypothetical protein [Vibrio vulnificus]MCA3902827.1 hypothetical protein [Vibrio vulnificus]